MNGNGNGNGKDLNRKDAKNAENGEGDRIGLSETATATAKT
jgi:hypothetical protein